jgi:hypothetical protein
LKKVLPDMMDISPLGVDELPLLVIFICRELAEQASEGKGSDGKRVVVGLLLRPRTRMMATKQNVIERAKRMVRMVKEVNANDAQQGKA